MVYRDYLVTIQMQDDIEPQQFVPMIQDGVQEELGHDQGIANVTNVSLQPESQNA